VNAMIHGLGIIKEIKEKGRKKEKKYAPRSFATILATTLSRLSKTHGWLISINIGAC
jgi:nucleoside recognition membrane protein YjiH